MVALTRSQRLEPQTHRQTIKKQSKKPRTIPVPVPGFVQIPVPAINQAPVSAINQAPVSAINQAPVPAINQTPVSAINQAPVPAVNQAHYHAVNQNPSHAFEYLYDPTRVFPRAPEHAFAHSTDHVFARAPEHVFAHSTDHVFARAPDHVFARAPEHVFAHVPEHAFASAPEHVRQHYGYQNINMPFGYGFYQPLPRQYMSPSSTCRKGVMRYEKYKQNAPEYKSELEVLEQWVDFAKKAGMRYRAVRTQIPEIHHGLAARFFFGSEC